MCGSRNFFQEGGVGPTTRKQSGQRFLLPNLFYSLQRGSNGFITEKTILFQGSRGGPTFSRGGGGGGGGVQMLISIETHIPCDFPGESETPIPPLDPHMTLNIFSETEYNLEHDNFQRKTVNIF